MDDHNKNPIDITQEILDGKHPELAELAIGCEHVPESEEEREFFKHNIVPRDYDDYPPEIADAYFKLESLVKQLVDLDTDTEVMLKYKHRLDNIGDLEKKGIQDLVAELEYDIAEIEHIIENESGSESESESDE